MLKGKRDRDESVGETMRDRENHYTILEREAESAIQGENEAQRELLEVEVDVEIKKMGTKKFRRRPF